ncbi:MAG: transglutaminase-like cysteine peptidase [Gammaproteobacteria bacterium]
MPAKILRFCSIAAVCICASCSTTPEPPPADDVPGIRREKLIEIQARYGIEARERVVEWRRLITSTRHSDPSTKLAAVNDFFNNLYFVDDILHWHQADYWATPIETLATNGGDCEDFTIAKYFTLGELGIPGHCMRLTYVKALELDKAHMVLSYQCSRYEDVLVLDNLDKRILPSYLRKDLIPVYSFNDSNLWVENGDGSTQPAPGGPGKLSKWMELLDRIRKGD